MNQLSYSTSIHPVGYTPKLATPGRYRAQVQLGDNVRWKGYVTVTMHKPDCEVTQHGEYATCTCQAAPETAPNMVLYSGIYSIIDRLISTDGSDTSDGFISYMEVGLSNTAVDPSQTALVAPKARRAITTSARSATNALFTCYFNGTQGNSNATTVASASSSTVFTVQAGQGSLFAVGQQIEVDVAGLEYTTITNISTDTLTVSPALSSTPPVSASVKQAISEVGMFGGSAASTTLGSGTAFARSVSFMPRSKDVGYSMTIEWHIEFT